MLSAYQPLIIIPEQMNKVKNSATVKLVAIENRTCCNRLFQIISTYINTFTIKGKTEPPKNR